MRVLCRHGHFAFYPRNAAEVARFSNFFDVTLVAERDYYTFEGLKDAPSYSLTLSPYLNLPAIKTFEGEPWEVMRENDFVYSLSLEILVPKLSIIGLADLPLVGYVFRGGTILQPGTRNLLGQQILSYDGEYIDEAYGLRLSGYEYE